MECQKFSNLYQSFQGILLDAYGVFWAGNQAGLLSGSGKAMQRLMDEGKIVGILSNSTQLVSKELDKLEKHGLIQDRHFHFLITSGEIVKKIFVEKQLPFPTPQKKYWLFGAPHPKFSSPDTLFEGSSYVETKMISEADFIYLSIPHINGEDQSSSAPFEEELRKLVAFELPMICANPDSFAHEGLPPKLVIRQGRLAQLYQSFGGKVLYIGKPSPLAYNAAIEEFEKRGIQNKQGLLMIGDTPETDIRGAKLAGLSSALVSTGIMQERILQYGGIKEAFSKLQSQDTPDFFIERLGCDGF